MIHKTTPLYTKKPRFASGMEISLSAHVRNLHMPDKDAALMVSKIDVPAGQALMGIYPALAILLGTDSPETVKDILRSLSNSESDALVEKISAVVQQPVYPTSQSIWQFNDPDVDIGMFSAAFASVESVDEAIAKINARVDFLDMLDMSEDTFPFMDILCEPLTEDSVLAFTPSDATQGEAEPAHISQMRANPERVHNLGADAVIVPSIAIGSLYLLSTKIKTFGEV